MPQFPVLEHRTLKKQGFLWRWEAHVQVDLDFKTRLERFRKEEVRASLGLAETLDDNFIFLKLNRGFAKINFVTQSKEQKKALASVLKTQLLRAVQQVYGGLPHFGEEHAWFDQTEGVWKWEVHLVESAHNDQDGQNSIVASREASDVYVLSCIQLGDNHLEIFFRNMWVDQDGPREVYLSEGTAKINFVDQDNSHPSSSRPLSSHPFR
ncbi:hypothetical protein T439DRAFT_380486 [Meredithblackwellia eburnea MCA 4105]